LRPLDLARLDRFKLCHIGATASLDMSNPDLGRNFPTPQ
jgi:hypothetical protein